jgi:segregation and condensation protein A
MRFLHLDVAADFLVMAATLMSIKSQMLLPRPSPVAEYAEDDPRQELVQKLLEYRLYKTAAQSLADRETETRLRFARPGEPVPDEADQETVLLEVTLFDLISAFEQIIGVEGVINVHEVKLEEITVKQSFDYILNLLQNEDKISFEKLIRSDPRPMIMVVTFLALLELIRARRVSVRQKEAFGAIWIYRQPTAEDDDHPFQERS